MADVAIEDIIASDVVKFKNKLGPPHGALVTKSATETGLNYSAALNAVSFNTETYDTSSCHDNVTNNSRLSVPSGWSWVRVGGLIRLNNVAASNWVVHTFWKNGAVFVGVPQAIYLTSLTSPASTLWSPIISVTGGTDYFQLMLQCQDTSMDIDSSSWFAIELIG